MAKLRPGGHLWPGKLFHPARKPKNEISMYKKESSFELLGGEKRLLIAIQKRWDGQDRVARPEDQS